jgi:serine phosphatase RsbU (regulator of sigma subunit)
MLQDLAALMGHQASLSQQLQHAAQVQQDLLPRSAPELVGYEFAAACIPSFAIGGDFYDWYPVPDGVDFSVADVMGKGIPAALVTATVRAVLRAAARSGGPATTMRSAADGLQADLGETGSFVTVFHGRIDGPTGRLSYCDAGHGLALHVRPDGSYRQLSGNGLPLGVEPHPDTTPAGVPTWTQGSVVTGIGDRIVCFSDGLFDLLGGTTAVIGDVAAMVAVADSCAEFIATVTDLAAGSPLTDDVTVVAIGRTPA